MSILSADGLARAFHRNLRVVEMQTAGLSHADSLVQTPYGFNCLNWVVGHLLVSRDDVLEMLGEERLLTSVEADPYRRESEPITGDGPGVLPLDRLLGLMVEGEKRITAALAATPEERFAETVTEDGRPLAYRLHFAYFHDTYHTGHTELLRRVAGFTDHLI